MRHQRGWREAQRIAGALLLLLASAGSQAELELRDLEGNEYRLEDHRGKWLVLNFWATWCPPCIHEMPMLQTFHQKHAAVDAVVWGVTFEDAPPGEIREFVQRLGVSYPILGTGFAATTPFGPVRVLPTTFLLDPSGRLRQRFEGPVTVADLERAAGLAQ